MVVVCLKCDAFFPLMMGYCTKLLSSVCSLYFVFYLYAYELVDIVNDPFEARLFTVGYVLDGWKAVFLSTSNLKCGLICMMVCVPELL